jgi:hypothetical protein
MLFHFISGKVLASAYSNAEASRWLALTERNLSRHHGKVNNYTESGGPLSPRDIQKAMLFGLS